MLQHGNPFFWEHYRVQSCELWPWRKCCHADRGSQGDGQTYSSRTNPQCLGIHSLGQMRSVTREEYAWRVKTNITQIWRREFLLQFLPISTLVVKTFVFRLPSLNIISVVDQCISWILIKIKTTHLVLFYKKNSKSSVRILRLRHLNHK